MANSEAPPYRLFSHFVQVVEAKSLREAARRFGVSAPVVSTAIAELEARVGVTLLRRGRQGASLTADGAALYEAAEPMVRAAEHAMAAVAGRRTHLSGRLALTLPTELSLSWLPLVLREFQARHPQAEVTVHAIDTVVDLAKSDFHLAIRAVYSVLGARGPEVIDVQPLELVASPQALPGKKRAALPALMRRLPFIGFTARRLRDGLIAVLPGGRTVRIPTSTTLRVNNGYVAKELAKQGLGAALVLASAVKEDLAGGALVRIAERETFGFVILRAVYRDRLPPAIARAFVEVVRASAA
ncbi:MAG: LysR family transcriptional regulator [Dongiaceae bacterium]